MFALNDRNGVRYGVCAREWEFVSSRQQQKKKPKKDGPKGWLWLHGKLYDFNEIARIHYLFVADNFPLTEFSVCDRGPRFLSFSPSQSFFLSLSHHPSIFSPNDFFFLFLFFSLFLELIARFAFIRSIRWIYYYGWCILFAQFYSWFMHIPSKEMFLIKFWFIRSQTAKMMITIYHSAIRRLSLKNSFAFANA